MHGFILISALFAAVTSARKCEIETTVSQGQTTGCTRCPPVINYRGTAQFRIDDEVEWEEIGNTDQYGELSNGDGYFWEHEEGLSFHILPLGIPALQDEPSCNVKIGDDKNEGEGKSDHSGGIGGLSDKLECYHTWDC